MLNCEDIEHVLDAYLDGELPTSVQAEVHAHLLECVLCRQKVGMLNAVADVVGDSRAEPRPSADFTDRVVTAMRERRVARPKRMHMRRVIVAFTATAAAASILLAFALTRPGVIARVEPTVAGAKEEGLPTAVATAGEQTRAAIRGLHESVKTFGLFGREALQKANVAILRDMTGVNEEATDGELPFMGPLLAPFKTLLDLDEPLSLPRETTEPVDDDLEMI